MLKHNPAHIVVRLGIDRLYASRRFRVQGRRRRVASLLAHLFGEGIQAVLHLGHGAHQGHPVHLGEGLSLFDAVAVFGKPAQHLDRGRYFYLDRVLGRQRSAAGKRIFDLALPGLRRQNARLILIGGLTR